MTGPSAGSAGAIAAASPGHDPRRVAERLRGLHVPAVALGVVRGLVGEGELPPGAGELPLGVLEAGAFTGPHPAREDRGGGGENRGGDHGDMPAGHADRGSVRGPGSGGCLFQLPCSAEAPTAGRRRAPGCHRLVLPCRFGLASGMRVTMRVGVQWAGLAAQTSGGGQPGQHRGLAGRLAAGRALAGRAVCGPGRRNMVR
jgi:hypothetical protein